MCKGGSVQLVASSDEGDGQTQPNSLHYISEFTKTWEPLFHKHKSNDL